MNKFFKIALTCTVLWICFVIYLAFCYTQAPDELNEWGDFLAGFSAPVALFWLIFGYLQQKEMLAIAQNQLASEREAREEESQARHLAAQPVFKINVDRIDALDESYEVFLNIINGGNIASDLVILPDSPLLIVTDPLIMVLSRGKNDARTLTFNKDLITSDSTQEFFYFTISYYDSLNQENTKRFSLEIYKDPTSRQYQGTVRPSNP